MGLGGGANSSLHPPFRRKGGAPAPLHPPPGYGPAGFNTNSKRLVNSNSSGLARLYCTGTTINDFYKLCRSFTFVSFTMVDR